MPSERHIERLLQAFARKRREQAGEPLELHPATRRLLQGEVTRQFARPAPANAVGGRIWTRFLPRMAFAGALLAVLVVGAILFFPPREQSPATLTLAKEESIARLPALEKQPPPAALPPTVTPTRAAALDRMENSEVTTAPTIASASDSAAASPLYFSDARRDQGFVSQHEPAAFDGQKPVASSYARPATAPDALQLAEAKSTPATPPPAGGRPTLATSPAAPADASRSYGVRTGTRATAPAPRTAAEAVSSSDSLPLAVAPPAAATAAREVRPVAIRRSVTSAVTAGAPAPAVFVQKFAQPDSPAGRGVGKDTQRPGVLASFQFEQRGREIRIVDRDGSVYTGAIEEASEPSSTAKPDRRTTGRLSADKAQVENHSSENLVGVSMAAGALPPAVSFRVRGTNATLKQVVVFVGGVQPQAGVSQLGTSSRAEGITALSQPPGPNQFLNTRITGRVRLADGTELEINALPTPP